MFIKMKKGERIKKILQAIFFDAQNLKPTK